uniref:Uncharacterized protein n=1 Tax=Nelumbo nucifera TaxID=4432 RepID=A0A822ZDJ0_NELNU|nr:TPA_asm: hypothetical protein HUJ06_016074 [Nelumbo nucifera]
MSSTTQTNQTFSSQTHLGPGMDKASLGNLKWKQRWQLSKPFSLSPSSTAGQRPCFFLHIGGLGGKRTL